VSDATLETAERILSAPLARELRVKAIGGIGCWLHVRDHGPGAEPCRRHYGDVDLALPRGGSKRLGQLMGEVGLKPVESFNANSGASRRMFVSADAGVQVDVFIGAFSMCHEVPLPDEAFAPPEQLSLGATELLMTKLQVVQLSEKDVHDAASLLSFHDLGPGSDSIDADRMAQLLAADWGLWRTVTQSLERIRAKAAAGVVPAPALAGDVQDRVDELSRRIDAAKKSLKWRTRARVGDRVQWYEEPEEPDKEWIPVR
jgi:hypothetical protein